MTDVRLTITEEVGVPRSAEVVRCGVPLPAGALRDPAGHTVLVGGRPVRSQVLWSRPDGDGWVRWLGLAFPATTDALGTVHAVLRTHAADAGGPALTPEPVTGAAAAEPAAAGVTRRSDGVLTVTTGAVSLDVGLDPFELSGPDLGLSSGAAVLVDPNRARRPATVPADGVRVRHGGPLLTQVELAGRYDGTRRDEGPASWAFRARITATAGARSIDLDVALVNDADDPESEVLEWSVELRTAPVVAGLCGVFGAAHRSTAPFTVRHRGQGHARGIFATSEVVGGDEWAHAGDPDYHSRWEWAELHGRHASNWVLARNRPADDGDLDPGYSRSSGADGSALTVAAHRFAENHPADLAVQDSGIVVRLWPGDAGPLRLTQGAAKTRTVRLAAGDQPYTGMTLDSPLVPVVDAAAASSAVVPEYLPYLPEQYPNLEAHIREELSGWYQSGQSLGFHDFGDSMQGIVRGPRTGYSANNEHDALLALTLHHLRTGERVYYDSAQAYADHLCDMDLIHHSTAFPGEVGGLRAHGRGHVHYVEARTPNGPVRTSIDTGHLWTEGLVLFSAVSGEERYLDAARQVADCLVGLTDLGWTRPEPGPRNSGWPLMALTAVARATGEDRYLEAAQRTAEAALAAQHPDGRWLMRIGLVDDYCAWQNAVLLIGLARLRDLADTAVLRTAFRDGSRALLELGRNRDGTFIYLTRFDYRWANRSALVREALGLAFEETGDDRFLKAGLAGGSRWYRPRGAAAALSNDVAEWRGHLPFLASAHRAGLLHDLSDAG